MNLSLAADLLTLSRIILTPLFFLAVARSGHSEAAADAARYIFLWVAVSDTLDGNLARLSRVKNRHGCFLDALADRVFIGFGYLTMYQVHGMPPLWLFLIVAFRVVGLGILWFIIFFASGLKFTSFIALRNVVNLPHPLGKTAVDIQLIFMGVVLFNVLAFLREPLIFMVAFFSIASAMTYIIAVYKRASSYDPGAVSDDERRVLEGITACLGRLRRTIFIWS
jgi:phosphatidylglycerophosphate synthase